MKGQIRLEQGEKNRGIDKRGEIILLLLPQGGKKKQIGKKSRDEIGESEKCVKQPDISCFNSIFSAVQTRTLSFTLCLHCSMNVCND